MFKTIRSITGILLTALAVFSSCSVKEDRKPCPGYLYVSFYEKESIHKEVGLMGWAQTERFRDTVDVSLLEQYWMRAVRHEVFELTAYMGADIASVSGHTVTIPLGSEADSLYAWHQEVDCTVGDAYAEAVFQKQFCTVHVDLVYSSAARMSDMKALVEGNTCGFDLLTYSAVEGPFRFEPLLGSESTVFKFRIPRQVDNSLKLGILARAEQSGDWVGPKEFPLGEYIDELGYDDKGNKIEAE